MPTEVDYIEELTRLSNIEVFPSIHAQEEYFRRISLFPHIFASFMNEEDKVKGLKLINEMSVQATKLNTHLFCVLVVIIKAVQTKNINVPKLIQQYEVEFMAAIDYLISGGRALEDNLSPQIIQKCREINLLVKRKELEELIN